MPQTAKSALPPQTPQCAFVKGISIVMEVVDAGLGIRFVYTSCLLACEARRDQDFAIMWFCACCAKSCNMAHVAVRFSDRP